MYLLLSHYIFKCFLGLIIFFIGIVYILFIRKSDDGPAENNENGLELKMHASEEERSSSYRTMHDNELLPGLETMNNHIIEYDN